MLKAFTTDYEHFADENTGLLPYLANAVKKLIQEEDNEKLQKLVDDIAETAENLYDLNDEVLVVKQKYDQMKNRREAIDRNLEAQLAAKAALDSEMQKAFGLDDDAVENPLDELIGIGAEQIDFTTVPQTPAQSIMEDMTAQQPAAVQINESAMANAIGASVTASGTVINRDQDLVASDALDALEHMTIEDMIDPSRLPSPSDEDLRAEGLVFGDEIDDLVERESEILDEDDEFDDEEYGNFDIGEEDVDDGYKPLNEVGIPVKESFEKTNDQYDDQGNAFEDAPAPDNASWIDDILGDDADLADIFDSDAIEDFDETDTGLPVFALPDDEEGYDGTSASPDDDLYADTDDMANVDDVFEDGDGDNKAFAASDIYADGDDDEEDMPSDAGFLDVTRL